MTTQHTPGPWTVSTTDFSGTYYVKEADPTKGYKQDEANANLIAAAPELLEALEALLNYDNLGAYQKADVRKQARAAVAKARGQA